MMNSTNKVILGISTSFTAILIMWLILFFWAEQKSGCWRNTFRGLSIISLVLIAIGWVVTIWQIKKNKDWREKLWKPYSIVVTAIFLLIINLLALYFMCKGDGSGKKQYYYQGKLYSGSIPKPSLPPSLPPSPTSHIESELFPVQPPVVSTYPSSSYSRPPSRTPPPPPSSFYS